ncbi:MAG: hypothetical protein HDS92_02570 [Bacteroidales bacterium]|nr:hypothetical protein [Bacteroidales bacterium]
MKKFVIALAASLLVGGGVANAKSEKRGVCVNGFKMEQMELLEPGICWYYNWGTSHTLATVEGVDFCPMGWSGINADAVRKYCKEHPEVKYLLGYNEPNFENQANLTPQKAAEMWPEMQALAKELNLKLVSPALNFSPNPPYQDPYKWMDEFVALVGKDAFDFVAIHNYGGFGVMKSFATGFHEKYGKPVWVTEWCYWPGGAGNVYVSPDTQIKSMIESVQWLEQTDFIFRYSWFMATGTYDAPERPNYGLVKTEGNLSTYTYALTPQGYVYTYMSDFDKSVWHAESEWVPAALVTDAYNLGYGQGESDHTDYPLMVTNLPAEGYAEYQFEIAAGDRCLVMMVGGYGEPTRFDPTLKVTATHEDGTVVDIFNKQFTLPNHDRADMTLALPFNAPKAGKYTVRVAAEGRNSGIILGALMIGDASGIESIETATDAAASLVDVYTVAGVKVRSAVAPAAATLGLPAGFYIVGNQKVLVK